MNHELKNIIEAILIVSDTPVGISKIQGLFEKEQAPEAEEIKNAIGALQADCQTRAIELVKIGNGFRYQSKLQYAQWIRKLQMGKPPKLSRVQLETLAIIAYRQPVSRGDIENIRGVAVSTEVMQRLLEREWIKQVGVRDVPGHPALFGTTRDFLSYFNLSTLSRLPDLMAQREFSEIAKDMNVDLSPEVRMALGQDDVTQKDVFDVSAEARFTDKNDAVEEDRGGSYEKTQGQQEESDLKESALEKGV